MGERDMMELSSTPSQVRHHNQLRLSVCLSVYLSVCLSVCHTHPLFLSAAAHARTPDTGRQLELRSDGSGSTVRLSADMQQLTVALGWHSDLKLDLDASVQPLLK